MLYSNVDIKSEVRSFEFGEISQVCLGEKGRNRQLLALTCPPETEIKKGINAGLTIGLTKSGKPRIVNNKEDNQLYMLLSSKGGYTRRGNGSIQLLQSAKIEDGWEILARGRGADGDAGRIGHWDVVLLKVPSEGIIRVRTGGAGYGTPSDLFVIHDNQVYHCTPASLRDCYDNLDIDMPCKLNVNEYNGHIEIDPDEWGIV